MKIAISGSTGLVGSALCPSLTAAGHQCVRIVRTAPMAGEIHWNPATGIDTYKLEGVDAVVHLAGENIAGGRWTAERKKRIRDSRVEGTNALSKSIASLPVPPRVLVCASAVGYYGDRGDQLLTEASSPGSGFLPELCKLWEEATRSACERGIRVVNIRIGMVLAREGGGLPKMLLPFKLGIGGKLGSGTQYMSWITIDDLVRVILHLVTAESLSGPVNAVTPNPVTNLGFTKTLGKILSRPTILPMPAFAARVAFGEMADALLLASARVMPAKLQADGFNFEYASLDEALRHVLRKGR